MKHSMNNYKIGIDIGSTTIKIVALDAAGELVFDAYRRHQTKVKENLIALLQQLHEKIGNATLSVTLTGSVGLGLAERFALPFRQEVVAATQYLRHYHGDVTTLVDIGGEDAKIVFLHDAKPTDLRMNGNCAGGTGAFIDQMAILLNVTPEELGRLAEQSTQLYPIASRCGVFCKTDIQNLLARNIAREDIAASIFHAVVVQTISTLAHGHDITAPLLFCGGPLSFIPALRKAFANYLHLDEHDIILPDKAYLMPAWGAALAGEKAQWTVSSLLQHVEQPATQKAALDTERLPPIFANEEQYAVWKHNMATYALPPATLAAGRQEAYMGIDSGSTTTKIVVLDKEAQLLFSYYHDNEGNPIRTVEQGLLQLQKRCQAAGCDLHILSSCSTGYGEDLIKAAFQMQNGIVETMAHYLAAKHIDPKVSFILDIGGQDMKAMFIENDSIRRIEVNEACSSGCGSFISTFARSLGSTVENFARAACLSSQPCDLGTRCTVFMNSKVKQVLREGASIVDIAAGLSFSVVKNCLYKVLRLNDADTLGDHIVVQGGTMRNDSVVRALELLTGKTVFRSDCPELMGALGSALYAMRSDNCNPPLSLTKMLARTQYSAKHQLCRGCENQCTVTHYRFDNQNTYYSGNRCEKIFTNRGSDVTPGKNAYEQKRALLFDRAATPAQPRLTIGIPRVLNMYEEYPFWHTLFTACNIAVRLSSPTHFARYEQCANKVMSDNICFPAKVVHSHIDELLQAGVQRIFMPFVVFERRDARMQNSYNCPIVSGYSQVVKSVQSGDVPIDSPAFTFKDEAALLHQCEKYLLPLGVAKKEVRQAFRRALDEQNRYEEAFATHNETLYAEARRKGRLAILLAGRPYHSDALIQHKVSEMVAALGAYVLTDDIVRQKDISLQQVQYLSQWAFTNRIIKAAHWCANEDAQLQYMQLTSFGCGPDAFLTDEVQAVLKRGAKTLTLLKIDDVNNIGSLKLRVRSLIESLRINQRQSVAQTNEDNALPPYTDEHRHKKILMPFFTPYISPLLPSLLRLVGYDAVNLPMSDSTSCDWGLKYSNNEICYPATLVVGDVVKAFRSGAYDPDNTCVAITQTGGQCRASNYLSLIRKALIENGYTHTPVVSVAFSNGLNNNQPAFNLHWNKLAPAAMAAILFGDCLSKFYHATIVRCDDAAAVTNLRDRYFDKAVQALEARRPNSLYKLIEEAAGDFDRLCSDEARPKVGIVGEIFLKFHPFAQKQVVQWLIDRKIEVCYPVLAEFFLQDFVNMRHNRRDRSKPVGIPSWMLNGLHALVKSKIEKVNRQCRAFRHFVPFDNIFDKAEKASYAITLNAQFGEGWLIAGEIATFAEAGVNHVISLQPFGCIANHVVEKGIENKLKKLYTKMNILSLDFDSSVSEVNIANRLLLFINNINE